MLLAIVHANGMYNAGEGINLPPYEMPDGYFESLARLTTRHVLNEQPVAYLPYWYDAAKTGIHSKSELQIAALEADPFYQALPPETRPPINVIPDGPRLSLNPEVVRSRNKTIDKLAEGQKTVCFVGAYAGACVLNRAVEMHDRIYDRSNIFIDPAYCVDKSSQPIHAWAAGWMKLERYSRYSE